MAVNVREARPEDAPGIAQVHVESWRTAYAGIVSQDYLDGLSVGDRERRWRRILRGDPESYESRDCVAESVQGRIVGFSSVGPERVSGSSGWELYAIYLLQSWQGAGLGRRLFAEALAPAEAGAPVSAWCLSANPHRRFYDRLGGKPQETRMVEIGGTSLEEIRYFWTDVQELRSRITSEC